MSILLQLEVNQLSEDQMMKGNKSPFCMQITLANGATSKLQFHTHIRFGPRFIAMNKAYDIGLRKLGKQIASELGMSNFFHEGVYTMVGGPSFGKTSIK